MLGQCKVHSSNNVPSRQTLTLFLLCPMCVGCNATLDVHHQIGMSPLVLVHTGCIIKHSMLKEFPHSELKLQLKAGLTTHTSFSLSLSLTLLQLHSKGCCPHGVITLQADVWGQTSTQMSRQRRRLWWHWPNCLVLCGPGGLLPTDTAPLTATVHTPLSPPRHPTSPPSVQRVNRYSSCLQPCCCCHFLSSLRHSYFRFFYVFFLLLSFS